MVDGRVTDGQRIAELLASELTGLALGPLAEVEVVDADPELTTTEAGSLAFRIAYAGTRVGSVNVFPEYAVVTLDHAANTSDTHPWDSLTVAESSEDSIEFRVASGRAVKPAVDAIAIALGKA